MEKFEIQIHRMNVFSLNLLKEMGYEAVGSGGGVGGGFKLFLVSLDDLAFMKEYSNGNFVYET